MSIVCCLLFSATPVSSETMGWVATYGGNDYERAYSIQQTRDGGYIVAGVSASFGGADRDYWVLKLRPDGPVEWQKGYGGEESDEAYSIWQTADGGYIMTGETMSFGTGIGDLWVLKLRADGSIEWEKTYGGKNFEEAHSIQQTLEGGYVIAGRTKSFGAGDVDVWVLKLKLDGAVEWEKTYGGEDWDEAHSIQQTSDGGYVVAGYTGSFVPRGREAPDAWVLKLRADGGIEWQKAYGGDNHDKAQSIQQTQDGGYIVAGYTESFGGWVDAWVLKLRPDGSIEWQKTYGGVNLEVFKSIQQTRDGGYIVTGDTSSFDAGNYDIWVLKLGPDGGVEWQKTYGGGETEDAQSIRQTQEGGYIVAGYTGSFGSRGGDFWVLKLRPDGSIDPSCSFIRDTSISGIDSSATVNPTNARGRDSNVNPQNSSATIRDTDASANIICPSIAIE